MEKNYIVLPGLEGNKPSHLNEIQLFLLEYIEYIKIFYWLVFCVMLISIVYFKVYKENKTKRSE